MTISAVVGPAVGGLDDDRGAMAGLTYPEVGATRHTPLPAGYRHLRHRTCLGPVSLSTAGDAVLSFAMHRGIGARVTTDATRAAPGVRLAIGVGWGPVVLTAPCEVVWTVDDGRRAGFAYGTLPGHPARGEEAFVVERDDDGRVWFQVTAFSTPAGWSMRLAGPVARLAQHGYARLCARSLRRLCGPVR